MLEAEATGDGIQDPAGEVAALQFAGGRSIAQVAAEWERDASWVESAIRRKLLEQVPQRAGGLKPARDAGRAERCEERRCREELQESLQLE